MVRLTYGWRKRIVSKKGKYEVQRFTCIPVETDDNGQYQLKVDQQGNAKIHIWRTGKHTKEKYQRPGQLMLTENNLMAVIIALNRWHLRIAIVKRHFNVF